MANEIEKIVDKPFQKAFIIANVCYTASLYKKKYSLISFQIASLTTPTNVDNLVSDFELSDYAFVGDIHQVCNKLSTYIMILSQCIHYKAYPFRR